MSVEPPLFSCLHVLRWGEKGDFYTPPPPPPPKFGEALHYYIHCGCGNIYTYMYTYLKGKCCTSVTLYTTAIYSSVAALAIIIRLSLTVVGVDPVGHSPQTPS